MWLQSTNGAWCSSQSSNLITYLVTIGRLVCVRARRGQFKNTGPAEGRVLTMTPRPPGGGPVHPDDGERGGARPRRGHRAHGLAWEPPGVEQLCAEIGFQSAPIPHQSPWSSLFALI